MDLTVPPETLQLTLLVMFAAAHVILVKPKFSRSCYYTVYRGTIKLLILQLLNCSYYSCSTARVTAAQLLVLHLLNCSCYSCLYCSYVCTRSFGLLVGPPRLLRSSASSYRQSSWPFRAAYRQHKRMHRPCAQRYSIHIPCQHSLPSSLGVVGELRV